MNTQVLEDLGLSKTEITLYMKLLEFGTSTAVELSKETKIHRPNVYSSMDKLVRKGLVSYYLKEDKKYYQVSDPEQLKELVKQKELSLNELIPQLQTLLLTSKQKSNVSIFEGLVGARSVLLDAINNTKNMYALGAPREYPIRIGAAWIADWHQKRISKGVTFHHIVNDDYHQDRVDMLRKLKLTSIKFLPKQYSTPNACLVYDKGVIITFMEPFVAIKIVSPEAAKSFKAYYDILDKMATEKRLKK